MTLPRNASEMSLQAADGTKVFASLYTPEGKSAHTIILMFHQARSSSDEYIPIAPRLTALGYDCLAVDLRSGGDMFGRPNKTAAQFKEEPSRESAYQDMEAALKWASEQQQYTTILAWGSSYSAALSFRLALEHPEIKGLIVFSPGEYLQDTGAVAKWNAELKTPRFIACTKDELTSGVQTIYAAGDPKQQVLFADNGVHGSSTLREDKNSKTTSNYWKQLLQFLKRYPAS